LIVNYLTMPANPMNARARMPAVTSEIGTPFIPSGISFLNLRYVAVI
jgi:hypothetical protein